MAEIISTLCHPQANSYVSYEELEDRLSVYSWWDSLTKRKKINAAILAASSIDSIPYAGRKLLIGQKLAFPRDTHKVVRLGWPFLKYDTNLSGVGYTVDTSINKVDFYLPTFPDSLSVNYSIGGAVYTATMDASGSITGTFCSGTAYKDSGYVTLNFDSNLDVGTTVDYIVSGYSRNTVEHKALKFNVEYFSNGFLKNGSIRLVNDFGEYFYNITNNNIVGGTLTLDSYIERLPQNNEYCYVIRPLDEDIKIAQIIQTVYIITGFGNFPIEGLRMIKIGDSLVTFSDKVSGYSKYVRMASRYGMHPAAFTRLVKYTIYASEIKIERS